MNKILRARWKTLKNVTENISNKSFPKYGSKGVVICEEWQDYDNFEKWMFDNGYTDENRLVIKRIDDMGDFCPDNCRLVTKEQLVRDNQNKPKKTGVRHCYLWTNGMYRSYVYKNGKIIWTGAHETIEGALKERKKMAKEMGVDISE